MQEIFNEILQLLSSNADVITLSIATGLTTAIVFIVKYVFTLVQKLVNKTPTKLDDTIIEKTRQLLKNKLKDL